MYTEYYDHVYSRSLLGSSIYLLFPLYLHALILCLFYPESISASELEHGKPMPSKEE